MRRAVASTSTRLPLSDLPISLFVPPHNTLPSPISLPLKRNASSLPLESGLTVSPQKTRKVSRVDPDWGGETIKRVVSGKDLTPKERIVLDRDDLGTGRSPARRLFGDGNEGSRYVTKSTSSDEVEGSQPPSSLGITGAVPAPQSSLSTEVPNRKLAPSPPIVDSPSRSHASSSSTIHSPATPTLAALPDDDNADIHDPGFVILPDSGDSGPISLGVGIGTPDSRKTLLALPTTTLNPPLALDAIGHIPSSPASSSRSYGSLYDENQENIPPLYTSASAVSSPSKLSRTSTSSTTPSKRTPSKHSWAADEEDDVFSTGSGRRRTIEKSRLAIENVISPKSGHDEVDEEDEELTPGRKELPKDKGKGREELEKEVDGR